MPRRTTAGSSEQKIAALNTLLRLLRHLRPVLFLRLIFIANRATISRHGAVPGSGSLKLPSAPPTTLSAVFYSTAGSVCLTVVPPSVLRCAITSASIVVSLL